MTADALSKGWEEQAERWVKWARQPGHDSYWRFHRDQFFELLPPPGELTVDIGCGEGRVTRDLKKRGHKVIGVDVSPTLVKYAQQADPVGEYHLANAAAIPLANQCCDLAIAFMSLQDVDDLPACTMEISRILKVNGRACLAIVHPINSSGHFADATADSSFVIQGAYLSEFNYSDTFDRDGLEMTFHSRHRTVAAYSRAFEAAGLLIEAIRENAITDAAAAQSERSQQWKRLPLFMHFRLVKAQE